MNMDQSETGIVVQGISHYRVAYRLPETGGYGSVPLCQSIDRPVPSVPWMLELYIRIGKELAAISHEVAQKVLEDSTAVFNVPMQVDAEMYVYWRDVLPPLRMMPYLEYPDSMRARMQGLPAMRQVDYLAGEGLPLIAGYSDGNDYHCLGVSGQVMVRGKTVKALFAGG